MSDLRSPFPPRRREWFTVWFLSPGLPWRCYSECGERVVDEIRDKCQAEFPSAVVVVAKAVETIEAVDA